MENDVVYGLSEISLYLSNIGKDDFAQTIEDACKKLELLKEPEAVEPIDIGYEINVPYPYRCGKCKCHIRKGQKYCDMCGKQVKWNEYKRSD